MFVLLLFLFSSFAEAESFACIAQGAVKKCGDCVLPVEFTKEGLQAMQTNCCELHLVQSYGEAPSRTDAEQKVLTSCTKSQDALKGTTETRCKIQKL